MQQIFCRHLHFNLSLDYNGILNTSNRTDTTIGCAISQGLPVGTEHPCSAGVVILATSRNEAFLKDNQMVPL